MKHFFRLPLFIILVSTLQLSADQWPQFRGHGARGIGVGNDLPTTWSATENVAWATEIPGRGWSSPIVWDDKVFITTVINSGVSEEPKKGLYFGGNRLEPPDSVHTWVVYCLDLKSGKINWEHTVHEAKPDTGIHIKNSFASETPVTDGERVYFYFGNVGLFAFDLEGNPVWSKPFNPHFTRHGWGTAASPALHGDRLYLVNDNEEDSWLLALDKSSGKELWKTARGKESNWSTPYVWENEVRTEIIVPATQKVMSYDLDGKELWSFEGMSSITIATPYEADGLLYVSSGYVGSRNKPIYAIRAGASGDISVHEADTSNEYIVWSDWRAAPYNPTTLVYDEQLYVLWDRGMLSSMNPKTGDYFFEKTKIQDSRAGFTSSPWAYNGKLFCLNEDGVTFVFNSGPAYAYSHSNALAEDDMCMATPAMAGDSLLIRSSARLYCIRSSD